MADETETGDLLPAGCGLWVGWIFASILGTLIGWFAGWRVSFLVPGVAAIFVLGGTVGLILGFTQWLVLRGQMPGASRWIPASALGWAGGFSIGVALAQQLGLAEAGFGLVVGAFTGAFVGLLQWMVLRGQIPDAGWWIAASVIAWASSLVYYQSGASWIGVLYGTLSGLITGTVLLWLLHRPVAEEARE